ncbi:MAG: 2-C-methyl-D-erythritol 4-phosphate cytidylyltransferase [Actinomyces sp.]|nr:2-C-methyl-D-erythritol 4-phosphate cytidylyltransferase [Actinomyces sp.]
MVALAVLTAAGSGTRLGCRGPKALVELGGQTLLERAARGLADAGIAALVVTAPPGEVDGFERVLPGHVPGAPHVPVLVVAGGESRQASVAAGLEALPAVATLAGVELAEDTPVLVHDAARCLTPAEVIGRVVAAVEAGSVAVVPGLPVTDTLKEVASPMSTTDAASGPTPEVRRVVATPDRSHLWGVQTPQGFRWSVLLHAHEHGRALAATESTAATDDASLVEALGLPVDMVRGDTLALKVTSRTDLLLAELLVEGALTFGG